MVNTAELVVILGCSPKRADDGFISEMLQLRLQKALEVIRNLEIKNNKFIVVTTGGGKLLHMKGTSTASVMKQWLIDNNVDSRIIFEENASMTTYENAINTAKLIRSFTSNVSLWNLFHRWDSGYGMTSNINGGVMDIAKIKIITSNYHLERARYLFEFVFPKIKLECIGSETPEMEMELHERGEVQAIEQTKKFISKYGNNRTIEQLKNDGKIRVGMPYINH
jgi:vancomycin permeability regulator SanA